jgi:DNA-binding GntR family transcriptional regulator
MSVEVTRRPDAASLAVHEQQAQVAVLAERIAARIAHRPPGWRLPRPSVLARHYGVPQQLLDEALADLQARQQVSDLGRGQFSRAGSANGRAPAVTGSGLVIRIEPVRNDISCGSRQDSYGPLRSGLSAALGLAADAPAATIQLLWTAGPTPVALSTTYLPAGSTAPGAWQAQLLVTGHGCSPAQRNTEGGPHAIGLQMSAASTAVASKLRLTAGAPVAMVLASYRDPADGSVRCATVAALRPEQFRIVIESAGQPAGGCFEPDGWQRALADQPR